MTEAMLQIGDHVVVQHQHLQSLLDVLGSKGYQVIGPTVGDSAIVYEEIDSVADLPVGWTDEQAGGSYRLKQRGDDAVFGYTSGSQSWKKFLHLPMRRLWQASRNNGSWDYVEETIQIPLRAFLGVRACELHAIAIQDRVFTGGTYIDPMYKALRDSTFIVAVNCGQAGDTCFCRSMNTGPQVGAGFDLAMTELLDADRHVFLVEVGTQAGAAVLADVPHDPADEKDQAAARRIVEQTARNMGRTLKTNRLKEILYASYNHSRWDEVAGRCLTCSNCTTVCPTCFCVTVEDVTDLSGDQAERLQRWDSCFTADFSYIHGGSVRSSTKSRYRQWMTHKLAAWIDQFGTSGCVGCGRCITWCPVGIDITEEARAMRERDTAAASAAEISTLNMV